jgi:hypothetical protein
LSRKYFSGFAVEAIKMEPPRQMLEALKKMGIKTA